MARKWQKGAKKERKRSEKGAKRGYCKQPYSRQSVPMTAHVFPAPDPFKLVSCPVSATATRTRNNRPSSVPYFSVTHMSQSGLPPDLQRQVELAAYVFAGCTGVFIWDILNNLRSDYVLLFKHNFHVACLAYVLSRIGTLIYVLGFMIFTSYPLQACNTAYVVFTAFYPIGISASAFLFFFRVHAIYGGDRLVTAIFGFLWLAVLGSSITVPTLGTAVKSGDSSECIVTRVEVFMYVGASGIILSVHDTLVFFAISYRLVSNFRLMQQQTLGTQLKMLFTGAHLPALPQVLFADGQMYYMITVVTNIVSMLLVYIPTVSPPYRGILVVPSMTLTSIMACRVYRNTKLGITHGSMELSLPTLNDVGPTGNLTIPPSVVQFSPEYNPMKGSALSEGNGDGSDFTGNTSGVLGTSSKADNSSFSSGVHQDTGVVP
ncbi:hypothetical protein B0H17DRAFT_1290103 [Mycena rosella]|uniref:Transmembrane protein n=1 Tax=Mycena rosella TaxID=1033263 RepID=A0AAD7FJ01_MYCRO|nr:hypothetical protein B0H17DRAFT_1290103 [Mycena rosella]